MTQATEAAAASLPAPRQCPYAPPAFYAETRESGRPRRGTIWDGSNPWLVATHDQVKQVLGDPRIGADVTDPAFPNTDAAQPHLQGDIFFRKDGEEHLPIRRLLNPDFTVKQVERWRPRIEQLVDEAIDDLLTLPRPLDLVRHFALRIPTEAICELLGVDLADSPVLTDSVLAITDMHAATEEKVAAIGRLNELLARCARQKQEQPDERLLSRLVNQHVPSGELTFDEVVRLGVLVIGAGHETTSNMLGLSVLALLQHADQRKKLLSDPDNYAATCAEEMLRYWSIVQTEPRRFAREDVEIGGQLINAGEGIICSLGAANRDPAMFTAPEELDVTRPGRQHLAFGHGVHQCLGQNLARIELQAALPRLFQRVPELRLAVPEDQLRFRDTHIVYGLYELPVTW
ncbi:cytochrome P450 (plasmid) [Streptomyces sp. R39]|uniref:Cytochrome P450 n=1 Tax=Streptomyces sp. R39 TaxID=3238631 RepID=A0AB39R587_9ACTN